MSQSQVEKDVKDLQVNFLQILTSDTFYKTSELINVIEYINNGLDNVKLDYEFQRGSKNRTQNTASNIDQIIAQGNDLARQLVIRLHINNIKDKELNQVREIHNWAYDALLGYLQTLQPYASAAYARLDNMAHHLGVTDRYIGYRNNLSRYGNQPIDVHSIWADRKHIPLESSITPDWKSYSHAFQHNGPSTSTTTPQTSNINSSDLGYMSSSSPRKVPSQVFVYADDHNTHISKAGIDVNFPGQTETVDRFVLPTGVSYTPSLAVAQPDYTSIGRPLARLAPEITSSEYTKSYKFPDASKMERYPWLRS